MSPRSWKVFSKLLWKNWHILSQDNAASNTNLGLSLWNTQHKRLQEHGSRLISNLSPRYFCLNSWPNSNWQQSRRELFWGNDGRVGGGSFKVVRERLVLSSNADFAILKVQRKCCWTRSWRKIKKEVDEIEALWSKALKDMVKSKVGLADDYIDILVRE